MPQAHWSSAIRMAALSFAVFTLALMAVTVARAQEGTTQPSVTVVPAQEGTTQPSVTVVPAQQRFPVPPEIFEKLNPEERATVLAGVMQGRFPTPPDIWDKLSLQERATVLASVTRQGPSNFWLMVIFLVFVGLLVGALFFYTFRLHSNFLKFCIDNKEVALFAQAPAGLPSGTIRSLIAFFIVLTAVFLILLTIRGGPFEGFPEVLGGVLGTVLGFYFGSRTASSSTEREAAHEISRVSEERNQAQAQVEVARLERDATVQAQATRLESTLETVKEGLIVANTIKEVLPEGLRGSAETVIGKVQGGLKVVEGLQSSGNVGDAVVKAIGLVKDVSKDGGVATLLTKAVGSFGIALGGAMPPLALAISVATIAARLSGAAYDRWMARVLDAPYTPALFPPSAIDANTGFVLLRKSPRFAAAFAQEIQRGDRAFVLEFVQMALSEAGSEAIRAKYPDRFATLQEIDEALNQFQQAAIELEVSKDITNEMAADVGGVEPLMRALDRINANPEARADMDALMLGVDKLRQANQPVEKLVHEARQEVEG
jgi:hypothetical protein